MEQRPTYLITYLSHQMGSFTKEWKLNIFVQHFHLNIIIRILNTHKIVNDFDLISFSFFHYC